MNLNKLYQAYPTISKPDFKLLLIALWLIIFGIGMIMSSSNTIGLQQYNKSFYFVLKHLTFIVFGLVGFLTTYVIPHQTLRKVGIFIWIVSLLLVGMTTIPGIGITIGGSTRWIRLLGITFQPSELMKFSLIVIVADYLDKFKDKINSDFQTFFILLCIVGVSAGLVFTQPDLGTTIIIAIVFMSQLFVAGIRLDWFLGIFGVGIMGAIMSIIVKPYQLNRVQAYLNPWIDQYGKGFHVIQSLIAVGTGGLFGMGLGQSRQKFFYLPQQYTDFIFSIICEELGFVYTIIFLVLPMILFYTKCFVIAVKQQSLFSKLLVIGITTWLGFQSLINIGVAINLMPTTGITLPFISFGGTSIVMAMTMTGIIMNASRYRENI